MALRVRQAQHFCGGGVTGESRLLQQLNLALGGGLLTRRVEECVARVVSSRQQSEGEHDRGAMQLLWEGHSGENTQDSGENAHGALQLR